MRPEVILEESLTRTVEEPVAAGAGNVQSDPASVVADGGDQGDGLDDAAGSEFVDDRIRLQE